MELALIALENALAAARPEPPRSSARYIVEQSKAVSDDGFRAALESANARAASTESASHCVEQGDTLWEICRDALQDSGIAPVHAEVQAAIDRVAEANQLRDPDKLSVGQQLDLRAIMPEEHELETPPESTAASTLKSMNIPRDLRLADGRSFLEGSALTTLIPVQAVEKYATSAQGGPAPVGILVASRTEELGLIPDSDVTTAKSVDAAQTSSLENQPITRASLMAMIERLLGGSEDSTKQASQETGPWSTLLRDDTARLSSSFGMRADPFTGLPEHHDGIDIAAPTGTEIYPYKAGQVVAAGWQPGYGRSVILRHRDGTETVYGHASKLLVRPGDLVTANDPIGQVGSTGRATGPHLHFEVRVEGQAVDPTPFLSNDTLQLAQAEA